MEANHLKLFAKMAGPLLLNPYYPRIRELSQRCFNLSLVLPISWFISQSSLVVIPKIAVFTELALSFSFFSHTNFSNCVYTIFNLIHVTMKNKGAWVFS